MPITNTEIELDTILKIVEICSVLGGGGLVAFRLGKTTSRVEATLKVQNTILETQAEEISELKNETRKLGEVLTTIAVQGERLTRLESDVRDMLRGKVPPPKVF